MLVGHDVQIGEVHQRVAQDIPGNALDDVLHELRAVGFKIIPLLRRGQAQAGHGGPARSNPCTDSIVKKGKK